MATRQYNSLKISQKLLTQIFSHLTIQDMGCKTPCWIYTKQNGDVCPFRYATISVHGHSYRLHRVAYVLFVDIAPDTLECDHLCNIRGCFNPSHIEMASHRVNTLRSTNPLAQNALKTHCPQGHEYTFENTVRHQKGYRSCKTCSRIRSNARNRAKGLPVRRDNSTQCKYGHPYTPDNLITNGKGSNVCRICRRATQQRYNLNKRASNRASTLNQTQQ